MLLSVAFFFNVHFCLSCCHTCSFFLCADECLSSLQGLPGPPGEKGENGDVGAMVSISSFPPSFSLPAIQIVFTYNPARWEIGLIVLKIEPVTWVWKLRQPLETSGKSDLVLKRYNIINTLFFSYIILFFCCSTL